MEVVDVRLDDDANDDETSAMITATTSVRVDITGMTCQKCERLIREALLEKVDGVVKVDVFRDESYANVELKTQIWSTKRNKLKSDIIEVIQVSISPTFYEQLFAQRCLSCVATRVFNVRLLHAVAFSK
jgi:copper chaperone CopZ